MAHMRHALQVCRPHSLPCQRPEKTLLRPGYPKVGVKTGPFRAEQLAVNQLTTSEIIWYKKKQMGYALKPKMPV
jgi:hypothetical protein